MFIKSLLVISVLIAVTQQISIKSSSSLNYVQFGNQIKSRVRRDLDLTLTDQCKNDPLDNEAKRKIKKHQYPLKDDSNFDLQIVWLGDQSETQFLLTTTDIHFFLQTHHEASKLYQSTDLGFSFDDIQNKINFTEIRSRNGIHKSPLNNNKLIFVSYKSSSMFGSFFNQMFSKVKSSLIITKDGGKTFKIVQLPFNLREGEPLLFNPKREDEIIALEVMTTTVNLMTQNKTVTGEAWISKDFGETWTVMMKGYKARSAAWGAAKGKEGDEIYLFAEEKSKDDLSFFSSSYKQTLWKSSDGGKFFEEIVQHCYNFGVKGDFVFASVDFNTSLSGEIRKMYVSKNSGKDFYPVSVPHIKHDKFYAVVEMFKDMIFLHVDAEGDTGHGTLYISDADGVRYTKSLKNHFYTNTGFTDFYNVESMPGVYISQVLLSDNSLKSVITYNRGVTWSPIKVDASYCKDVKGVCTLHFHHLYSKTKGLTVPSPLSNINAPGIVLMHAMLGDGLTGENDVWLSINGGYDWKPVAKGSHLYAIGDQGNLIVIYPLKNQTGNKIKYSIDMGRCWNEYEFTDSNDEITVRGLVTEPHSQERVFSLWGYQQSKEKKNKKEWVVFTVNFHEMFNKECDTSDFDEWHPHAENGHSGCLLGEQMTFLRPKLDATCYLGRNFKPSRETTKCDCTMEDMECDYGYKRLDSGKCVIDKYIAPREECEKGKIVKETYSKGYRRVPGNKCKAEDSTDDIIKYIDEKKECVKGKKAEENSEGIINREKSLRKIEQERKERIQAAENERAKQEFRKKQEEIDKQQANEKTKTKKKSSSSHGFAIFFSIAVAVALIAGGIWYYRKRRSSLPVPYTQSRLDGNDGNETEDDEPLGGFNPRPKSQRPYADETDVEDDIMLPV